MMEWMMIAALTVVLATAMWTDIRSSRIPNWLTFSAMGFACVAHATLQSSGHLSALTKH